MNATTRGIRITLSSEEYGCLRAALVRFGRFVMPAPAAGYRGDPVLWGLLQRLAAGNGVELLCAEPVADQQPAGEPPAEWPDLGEAGRPRT